MAADHAMQRPDAPAARGRMAALVLSAIPVGMVTSWLSGGSGIVFGVVLVVYMLAGLVLVVRHGVHEQRGSAVTLYQHSTVCSSTASGHGACDCGAHRG